MTHNHPQRAPGGRPEFDPHRSAEIRDLLVRTVAGTPRPRLARLSRTAFALAASAALLVAVGIGAGAVVAYDQLSGSVIAQDADAPAAGQDEEPQAAESLSGKSAHAVEAAAAADSQAAGELTPVLDLNGEIGYAYSGDLQAARFVRLDAPNDIESSTADGRVAIYRADGVTVLGYFDPAGLIP